MTIFYILMGVITATFTFCYQLKEDGKMEGGSIFASIVCGLMWPITVGAFAYGIYEYTIGRK